MASADREAAMSNGPERARRAAVVLAGRRGEYERVRAHLDDADPAVRAAAIGALVQAGAADPATVRAALEDPSAIVRRKTLELGSLLPRVALASLLTDPDPLVVEAAAFAIGELGDTGAVVALVDVAEHHADPLARESALAALGAIGDERGLPALLSALSGPPAIRRRAVVALAAFAGDAVHAALTERLSDRDWQVRQAAEEVLGLTDDPPR